MRPQTIVFLQGISAAAAAVAGLVFFRFWRDSRERLFAFFGAAFLLLAASWSLLGLTNPTDETRPYIYAIRLLAFLLIIAGVIDKNRERAD
ncbi:MAG TPA: DUF5985 family protein [Vicinamibacterales bacterium]|nr:DUF5985 family protein [Vicinamibacterales bacterium]